VTQLRILPIGAAPPHRVALALALSEHDAVKSRSPTDRVIAAMLLIFMLGFLCVNAHSTSHGQFKHSHHPEDSHHAGHHHDDTDAAPASTEHSHPHDPLDHTHDIPLRMLISNAVEPTFFRGWLPRIPHPFHSAVLIPLERPPKPRSTA
jgi:hypothetical protein